MDQALSMTGFLEFNSFATNCQGISELSIQPNFLIDKYNEKQTRNREPFLKIAFVTDAYNYGRGGDVATIRMAAGLKKRGYEITVVAARSVQQERFF